MSPELPLPAAATAGDGSRQTARAAGGPVNVAPEDRRAVYLETYGCQMNVADSEVVAAILGRAGYRLVDLPEEAEVILLNTCAVRENAEERVIGRASQLNALRTRRPDLTLGILGCMAQHLSVSLPARAPWVDLVAGPDAYSRLPELLAQTADEALLDTRPSRSENYLGIDPVRGRSTTTAWVTAIRGCDRFCTFCIVPYVRGRERSVPADEVLRQVRALAAEGFHEVTLLGQTVNSYRDRGRGGDRDVRFADLLRRVASVDGIWRIRFTSPHPADFDEAAIAAIAELPQVCPALHLPVQSGSDAQLAAMRRGYTVGLYRDLVARLRSAVPGLALTTDIIVGFCGETDDDFRRTCELMEEIRFDSAFLFGYSERSGTQAARSLEDDVPEAVKGERLRRVIELQERISHELNQDLVGRSVEVLVEGESRRPGNDGRPSYYGRSPQNKVTVFPEPAPPNGLVVVAVERATSHTLFGSTRT